MQASLPDKPLLLLAAFLASLELRWACPATRAVRHATSTYVNLSCEVIHLGLCCA